MSRTGHVLLALLVASGLARLSQTSSTAAADPLAVAGRTPAQRLEVVSATPSPSFSPCGPPRRRFVALVTNGFEKCGSAPARAEPAADLYARHCAQCHGADRLGGSGPALVPENFERLDRAAARAVIAAGRPATQMPPFAAQLGEDEIDALVEYVFRPATPAPEWPLEAIRASRIEHLPPARLPAAPVHAGDPLNLFFVVEAGDHHATILDGDRFEAIARFPTRRALHGGPKFSPDGRFVYTASRDGWIALYDLHALAPVAEIRAGINTRNLAVSADGRRVLVGNYLPHTLVVLDARDLAPIEVLPARDAAGHGSRVSAVYDAPARRSFIVALKDARELWEIPYGKDARPIHAGLGEALPDAGTFPIRRIAIDDFLDDFSFDQGGRNLIGAERGGASAAVVSLIAGRTIARVPLPGLPHLGSAASFEFEGRPVLATPNLEQALVTVIDLERWVVVRQIPTLGPGFFLRTHAGTPYAWLDVFSGPHRDAIQVIDKRTLEIVATLRPSPGRSAGHVEFTRDGRHALVSVWEHDGAVVVYDARALREVARLPMRKPIGKYNVYNRTRGAGGGA
jgi:mono/diheme cytochrome c family protein